MLLNLLLLGGKHELIFKLFAVMRAGLMAFEIVWRISYDWRAIIVKVSAVCV